MARMCADMPCPQWQARITTTPQRASAPACILYSLKQATACTVGGGRFHAQVSTGLRRGLYFPQCRRLSVWKVALL